METGLQRNPPLHPDNVGVVDPVGVADAARLGIKTDPKRRSTLGQFLTPPATARFMASLSALHRKRLRLLDAGAGAGTLTAAWVQEVCSRPVRPQQIELTAYEVDEGMLPALRRTLEVCEEVCTAAGIECHWEVRPADFIEAAVKELAEDLFRTGPPAFDVAILNPPYKKFRAESRTRDLLRRLDLETSNLYAAFVSLAVLLLDDGGEFIAITPRSFCNGPYFRPFRRHLLRNVNLTRLHVFEVRNHAFRDDGVLQENVIVRAEKGILQQPAVLVSQSRTPDEAVSAKQQVPFGRVVRPLDPQSFIHLVPEDGGQALARDMERLPCTLDELGLCVSTGRVVDFRARQWLRIEPGKDTVPLIYPGHFDNGVIRWPKNGPKKPNAIAYVAKSAPLMVPAGPYVLVRRFSAKEERRRVVAAVFSPDLVPCKVVGFENHLNYFHQRGAPLDAVLARGLSAFLNCSSLDTYFRQFSGHTQVNATDLRALRYPRREALLDLGARMEEHLPPQGDLDAMVAETFRVR